MFMLVVSTITQAQTINQKQTFSSAESMQPFLFTLNTISRGEHKLILNYSGGYGERAVSPLGYNGVEQNIGFKGYIGANFTLIGSMGIGLSGNSGTKTFQQVELVREFFANTNVSGSFKIGGGLGFRREFSNDKVLLSRITANYESVNWRLGANMRLEKAFGKQRDGLDIISSVGIHHQINNELFAGIEAVGQDLEGFWETNETEGGARLLVGPSLNFTPQTSKFLFSVCGGPIIYATHNVSAFNNFTVRELPAANGFTVKFNVGFKF